MPDLTSHGFFVRKPQHRGPQESSVLCQLRELLAGARCHEAILSLQAWKPLKLDRQIQLRFS